MKQDLGVCTYRLTQTPLENDFKSLEFSNRPILGLEKKVSSLFVINLLTNNPFLAPSNKMSTSGTQYPQYGYRKNPFDIKNEKMKMRETNFTVGKM